MINMKRFIAFFLILISLFIICSCDCEHQWNSGRVTKVATDTVTCSPCVIGDDFTDGKQYAPIYDTVASARLDCVVAALTNQSREAAQRAVRGGLVEVNFEPIERTDLVHEAPAWISVRGFGRYRLRAFDGETKKGRLRMKADRLI